MSVDELVVDFRVSQTLSRYLASRFDLGSFAGRGRIVGVLARHSFDILNGGRLLCCIRAGLRTATGCNGEHDQ